MLRATIWLLYALLCNHFLSSSVAVSLANKIRKQILTGVAETQCYLSNSGNHESSRIAHTQYDQLCKASKLVDWCFNKFGIVQGEYLGQPLGCGQGDFPGKIKECTHERTATGPVAPCYVCDANSMTNGWALFLPYDNFSRLVWLARHSTVCTGWIFLFINFWQPLIKLSSHSFVLTWAKACRNNAGSASFSWLKQQWDCYKISGVRSQFACRQGCKHSSQ